MTRQFAVLAKYATNQSTKVTLAAAQDAGLSRASRTPRTHSAAVRAHAATAATVIVCASREAQRETPPPR